MPRERRTPRFLTIPNAAKELGVSRQRIHVLLKRGQLRSLDVPGVGSVIPEQELRRLKNNRSRKTGKPNRTNRPSPPSIAGGGIGREQGTKQVPPPVVPFPELLPLHDPNFSWEQFEGFCEDFISLLPGVRQVHRLGRRGSRQKGVDIIAELESGERWAFQCRQWGKLGPHHVRRTIRETTYSADRYVLLLSRIATSSVREEVEKYNWSTWDVGDISRKVRELPLDSAGRLLETRLGPYWRRAFLGTAGLTPFAVAEDFFRPLLDSKNLFNHAWTLVGRSTLIDNLHELVKSEQQTVALVIGRGGIGKSKLLHQFSREFDPHHSDFDLRFAVEGVPITPESVDHLSSRPLVLVVDDAHRREDLPTVLAFARRASRPVKLILVSRPQGVDLIRTLLTQSGFDPRETLELPELIELGREEMEQLARQALGADYAHLAERLAAVTWDSPLVTVVAGRLLAEKAVDPSFLEREEDFRRVVFSRFRDVLLGQVSDIIGPDLCRRLLDLIAVLSPIRPADAQFQEKAAEFLKTDKAIVLRALGELEQSGVLLRRGYTLRITPDVLSDHLLHDACLNHQGRRTGYAEMVFEAFASIWPGQILRNLAELDWRVYRTRGEEIDLLDEIWSVLESSFRASPHSGRCHIVDLLDEVAFFLPKRTLPLIEYAIRNPADAPEDQRLARLYRYSHGDVVDRLPKLLDHIAHNLDYLPRCCDLLWEIGRDDARSLNPNPGHAMRILADLAGYKLGKPLSMNVAVANAVARWFESSDAHEHVHSPLDVLDPMLEKTGMSSYSKGHTFVLRPFQVSPQNTRSTRKRALALVMTSARSGNLKVVIRALRSLEEALREPLSLAGLVITDEDRAAWLPDQLEVLDLVAEIVTQHVHPLVQLQIPKILGWHATHNPSEAVRQKARSILVSIHESYELRLTRVLVDGFGLDWLLEEDGDEDSNKHYQRREERANKQRQAVAKAFLKKHPRPEDGFNDLNEQLGVIHEAGVESNPSRFLYELSKTDPQYAATLCETIIQTPNCALALHLAQLLFGIRESDAQRATELCKNAVESDEVTVSRSVAHAYRAANWLARPEPADSEILGKLLSHSDLGVKRAAIGSLSILGRSNPRQAVSLATTVDIGAEPVLAKELCSAFDAKYGIPMTEVRDEELVRLLAKLEATEEIDDYQISEFLATASDRVPVSVVELLLRRIDHAETAADRAYTPLPHLHFHHSFHGLGESGQYESILRMIRDRALKKGWRTSVWVPNLFKVASLDFAPKSLSVLDEWINSGDPERVEAASLLLTDAPSDFIFTNSAFVSTLLERAYAAGEECYRSVGSNLYQIAVSGVRSGTPGQPMPQDVELRDKSRTIATTLPVASPVRRFYDELAKHADASIKDDLARDEELFAE